MDYYRANAQFPTAQPLPSTLRPNAPTFVVNPQAHGYDVKPPSTPPPHASLDPSLNLLVPRTYPQWQVQAKRVTAEYKELGFNSPVAWVYVEGQDIPPNAIIGGVDRKTGLPWYIARAFYEGSIELGKAGRQFRLGATVVYNGRERDIGAYEILVEARTPTRWIYQEVVVPAPSREALSLRRFKTVVIVDDSTSMEGQPWVDAREALAGVAELTRRYEADGLDVYFLNDSRYQLDLRDQGSVRNLFDSVVPDGQTPTGTRLQQVLDTYIPRLQDPNRQQKPINLIVITDGVPTDDPKSVIVGAARRLDDARIPLRQLGIQFVQIGDDSDASAALRELDDDLSAEHGVRDMVDTTLFNPNEPQLRTESLLKILTGALDSDLDNDEKSPTFPQV